MNVIDKLIEDMYIILSTVLIDMKAVDTEFNTD